MHAASAWCQEGGGKGHIALDNATFRGLLRMLIMFCTINLTRLIIHYNYIHLIQKGFIPILFTINKHPNFT